MSGANPWDIGQLVRQPGGLNLNIARYNPRPAGVIRHGSTTHQVLECLQAHPGDYLRCANIIFLTRCTTKGVSHALLFLRAAGLVEVAQDNRSERYLRYRFSGGQRVQAQVSEAPQTRSVSVHNDAPPMPETGARRFQVVRRERDPGLPTVAEQLVAVPGGHGPSTVAEALAGAKGCPGELRAAELRVDRTSATDPAPGDLHKDPVQRGASHDSTSGEGLSPEGRNASQPPEGGHSYGCGPDGDTTPNWQASIFHEATPVATATPAK